MADKKNQGFQSGAGLIRYFDEEEINGPALDPKLIIYIGIAMAVIVELAKIFWPVWNTERYPLKSQFILSAALLTTFSQIILRGLQYKKK